MKINLRSMYDTLPAEYGDYPGILDVFVDNSIYDNTNDKAIAMMVEPRSILPDAYRWMETNYDKFAYVFTFDSELLKLPNAKLLLYGQITAEFPFTEKTKNISMVASSKDFCQGHKDRQYVACVLSDRIDVFGKFNGGKYCEDSDFMSEHRFNVAMENYSDGYYFTEKICNCFASKVVPIYWGCPHIEDYFDMNGIIYCKTPDEVIESVDRILQNPIEEYEKRWESIEKNYILVQKYRRCGDLFLKTYGGLLGGIAQ